MTTKITKTKGGKFKATYKGKVYAKSTTKEKAESQRRLLNAKKHGWKPTKKKGKK
jgi:hypothetical protein